MKSEPNTELVTVRVVRLKLLVQVINEEMFGNKFLKYLMPFLDGEHTVNVTKEEVNRDLQLAVDILNQLKIAAQELGMSFKIFYLWISSFNHSHSLSSFVERN